ncbi:ribonuclease N [Chryseobacterium sp. SSA4.19]|uniref:ribonuclease domain-containing protein n=1 Tax=Chryseobacterium sp. SSA4.19 TaxID=2919915 RepID=UPI001F4EC746|nr:ribonuclease domain-containing protein [Chryseobacterium sp. SSA4.19]MCJ8155274.1 ribonuclease N [Chryseobacterium sp. SSA4.19]
MTGKTRSLFFICLGLLFGMSVMYVYHNFIADKKSAPSTHPVVEYATADGNSGNTIQQSIDQLTAEKTVVDYVKKNHTLPAYYISKNEARSQGWDPSKGNLCEVLPGKAIGGDCFGNREGNLPKDETYYEADVNYHCGNRNADRIVFTKNGKVYLTKNHYKSFKEQ